MHHSSGELFLQEKFQTQKRANAFYANQMIDFLNKEMIDFIALQEMLFTATADGEGNCDTSFRAGKKGFVRVIDEKTVIFPEYRGNGVMASLGNITENPHIGLLFIDFIQSQVGLHINGKAAIVENDELEQLPISREKLKEIREIEESLAERWVVVTVDEAYMHCSKHIPVFIRKEKDFKWGTDDEKIKGGDFFKVKEMKRASRDKR